MCLRTTDLQPRVARRYSVHLHKVPVASKHVRHPKQRAWRGNGWQTSLARRLVYVNNACILRPGNPSVVCTWTPVDLKKRPATAGMLIALSCVTCDTAWMLHGPLFRVHSHQRVPCSALCLSVGLSARVLAAGETTSNDAYTRTQQAV